MAAISPSRVFITWEPFRVPAASCLLASAVPVCAGVLQAAGLRRRDGLTRHRCLLGMGLTWEKFHLRSNLKQFFLLISHRVEMAISQAVPVILFIILTLFFPFLPHSLALAAIIL